MLLLKKHLVALVRAGKKRQTIRVWSRPIVRAGQVSYTPGLGKMLILGVDEIADFGVLTDVDAKADGFADRAALLLELRKIYGAKMPSGKRCYRVHFQWPLETQPAAAPATPMPALIKAPDPIGSKRKSGKGMTAAQRRKVKAFVLKRMTA